MGNLYTNKLLVGLQAAAFEGFQAGHGAHATSAGRRFHSTTVFVGRRIFEVVSTWLVQLVAMWFGSSYIFFLVLYDFNVVCCFFQYAVR